MSPTLLKVFGVVLFYCCSVYVLNWDKGIKFCDTGQIFLQKSVYSCLFFIHFHDYRQFPHLH